MRIQQKQKRGPGKQLWGHTKIGYCITGKEHGNIDKVQ